MAGASFIYYGGMKWENRGRSRNVEDRRGRGGRRSSGAGVPMGIGGFLVLLVLSLVFGVDFFSLIGGTSGGVAPVNPSSPPAVTGSADGFDNEETVDFVSFVLDDAQATWAAMFEGSGVAYQDATLVLYRDAVQSGCGYAPASTGPFYCPSDGDIYLDLSFYDALRSRYGAPGDFAQAYVLAHEIGHHVQNLLGTAGEVRRLQSANPGEANDLSVALELQADCYAGVWGRSFAERGRTDDKIALERGDLEEGLSAAAAVGDDRLQRQASGRVNPETFTHGTSEERMKWFTTGFDTGDPNACDTFASLGM